MRTKYQASTIVEITFEYLQESYPHLRGYVELDELEKVHILYEPIADARKLIKDGKIRYRRKDGNVEVKAEDFLWYAAESQVEGVIFECEGEDPYAEPEESGDGNLNYELAKRKSANSFPGPFSNGW